MGNTKSKLRVANRYLDRKNLAGDSAHDDDTVQGISYTILEEEPEADPSSELPDHRSALADPFNITYNPWNSSATDQSDTECSTSYKRLREDSTSGCDDDPANLHEGSQNSTSYKRLVEYSECDGRGDHQELTKDEHTRSPESHVIETGRPALIREGFIDQVDSPPGGHVAVHGHQTEQDESIDKDPQLTIQAIPPKSADVSVRDVRCPQIVITDDVTRENQSKEDTADDDTNGQANDDQTESTNDDDSSHSTQELSLERLSESAEKADADLGWREQTDRMVAALTFYKLAFLSSDTESDAADAAMTIATTSSSLALLFIDHDSVYSKDVIHRYFHDALQFMNAAYKRRHHRDAMWLSHLEDGWSEILKAVVAWLAKLGTEAAMKGFSEFLGYLPELKFKSEGYLEYGKLLFHSGLSAWQGGDVEMCLRFFTECIDSTEEATKTCGGDPAILSEVATLRKNAQEHMHSAQSIGTGAGT